MPCNCGNSKPKESMTSAAATALYGRPKYKVIEPGGGEKVHDLYVEAKTHQRESGGTLTEVRESV